MLFRSALELMRRLDARGIRPDLATDQTSAHDPLVGYVPDHLSLDDAARLRAADPAEYERRSIAAMGTHVAAMREMQKRGAIAFDYGNNIRAQAVKAGVAVSCKRHLPIWNDERALSEMVKEAAWEISCRLHYPKLLNEGRRDTGAIGTHLHREVRGARRPS